MKIVNNKIYIVKGETPLYDVSVIDDKTGAPYMVTTLPDDVDNPGYVIQFNVTPSIYDGKNKYVYNNYLLLHENLHTFPTTKIEDYLGGDEWRTDYSFADSKGHEQNRYALFRKEVVKGSNVWEYKYFENGQWNDYELRISFMFPYEATSKMEPKTYKYEVTLFGGSKKDFPGAGENPVNITYKKPLLEATDFIVGGSSSD